MEILNINATDILIAQYVVSKDRRAGTGHLLLDRGLVNIQAFHVCYFDGFLLYLFSAHSWIKTYNWAGRDFLPLVWKPTRFHKRFGPERDHRAPEDLVRSTGRSSPNSAAVKAPLFRVFPCALTIPHHFKLLKQGQAFSKPQTNTEHYNCSSSSRLPKQNLLHEVIKAGFCSSAVNAVRKCCTAIHCHLWFLLPWRLGVGKSDFFLQAQHLWPTGNREGNYFNLPLYFSLFVGVIPSE